MDCLFPTCTRIAQSNGYCIGHSIYAATPVIKVLKEVNKVSDKMKVVKAELKKLYPIFLKSRPWCAIKSPACTQKATVVHHDQGRGPNEILNQATWVACCPSCNEYVESHHAWAEERGFKKSRHKKND